MSNNKLAVGDTVEYLDKHSQKSYLGNIVNYSPGRDTWRKNFDLDPRDYFVTFEQPLWENGPNSAWCAAEDLNIIKSHKLNTPTVTYTNSSTTVTTKYNNDNLRLEKNNKLAQSTISTEERPWTRYYVTADEFFDVLRLAFDETYGGGSETPWHPEDMYVNVSTTLEIVANTLSNMANLKAGRQLKGIKEI